MSEAPSWAERRRRKPKGAEADILRLLKLCSLEHGLLEPNDHILVALSGGKDSYVLAYALWRLQHELPFSYRLSFINVDLGFGGFRQDILQGYLAAQGIELIPVVENAGEICGAKIPEDESPCWLCSRLRRGILYTRAKRLGANKLALGHHGDDLIETLLLSAAYSGQLKSMPPKLLNDEGTVSVIRPLAYTFEKTIAALAEELRFPIINCNCAIGEERLPSRRHAAKALIARLEEEIPDLRQNLLTSMKNIRLSHLLMK